MSQSEFRQHLPDPKSPRFMSMQCQDAYTYADAFKSSRNPPWLHALWLHWLELYHEPFKGITADGSVEPGLFHLQQEDIAIDMIVCKAQSLLDSLTPSQRNAISFHIESPEWRTWSNPEFLLSDKGIRLDQVSDLVRTRSLDLLQASLSPQGYEKAISAMRINGFLGELVGATAVCSENSYNLALFGSPSTKTPWGFSFYGHHLCLNLFFYQTQIVISPWFTGAEPNLIDEGPYAGTRILYREEHLGLQLMQGLPSPQQARAQIYKEMRDPLMPPGRWNRDDQRHLCGAFRDNRVVPYEGQLVSEMNKNSQRLVRDILDEYMLYLPDKARQLRLEHLSTFFHRTYFSWIGRFGDRDAFYYRIQSPVIIVEFDHHSGVFLDNPEPARFHTHTLLRTPNGGDYGKALLPLIPRMEQAFVWQTNVQERNEAKTAGHQAH
jgi:hypothetical protein